MKINCKNLVLLLTAILLTTLCSAKKKINKETEQWKYEVEATGVGVQGTYQIKVWTYSSKEETAIEQAKKNAVHAIMYKGFPTKDRIKGQKPLVRNTNFTKEQNRIIDNLFKDKGEFQRFVTLSNNGAIAPGDRIKLGRKKYKIGVVVSVNVAELRKFLEDQGIIQKLSAGF